MIIALGLLFLLLAYGSVEYLVHVHNRRSIPIRIHVNGTRGKSSVTRLIATGLRASGISTMAKATGTLPRIIDEKDNDIPIFRIGRANIFEQAYVFSQAARRDIHCLVVEYMAITPRLQQVTEDVMVKSTIGVITNVRRDHLDVMGPTVEDVALALSATLPHKGIAFTAEADPGLLAILKRKARARVSLLKEVRAEEDNRRDDGRL